MNAIPPAIYDLAVIGGGINGVGIARDAAGRGLSVLLVEKDDLAAHTSSSSTKLIHGGLRYLEHYEFRLVAESLSEREVLLKLAPHIIEPLQFVLPHEPHLRPAWMIRSGLFLYDHIGGRKTLPSSFGVDLGASKWGAGLKNSFRKGFVYSDARVDDARLVVLNAIGARELGADVRVRTRLETARRENGLWRATLIDGAGRRADVLARALINAAGPWVKELLDQLSPGSIRAQVRHVKGSHIVVPRVHPESHAYILQNSDKRIVFIIPFQQEFSLIGTTDVPVDDYDTPHIAVDEIDYLCSIANAYLARGIAVADIVWTYSGVRPLYDEARTTPRRSRAITCSSSTPPTAARRCCRSSAARSRPTASSPSTRSDNCAAFFRKCAPTGPIASRCRAATCRREGSPRTSERLSRAIAGCRPACLPRSLAGTARGRRASSAMPAHQPIWARISATRCTPPKSITWSRGNGPATPTTCSGGEPSAGCI